MSNPAPKPEGWRPEWKRRERIHGSSDADRAHARARELELAAERMAEAVAGWLEEPMPAVPALREEMLRVLRGVAKAEVVGVEPKDRIMAAHRVLEWTDPKRGTPSPDDASSLTDDELARRRAELAKVLRLEPGNDGGGK